MSEQQPPELTEEQLRQIEAEMERITVDDVLLQTVVTLLNLGARKAGLGGPPSAEPPQPDLDQMKLAIEGARALMPLLESRHGDQLGPIRDALSRLQMAFAQLSGSGSGGAGPAGGGGEQEPAGGGQEPEAKPGGAGPAQKSGRLWVPGQ
jgi:hypothetical protein